jgi:hypothetical protein
MIKHAVGAQHSPPIELDVKPDLVTESRRSSAKINSASSGLVRITVPRILNQTQRHSDDLEIEEVYLGGGRLKSGVRERFSRASRNRLPKVIGGSSETLCLFP